MKSYWLLGLDDYNDSLPISINNTPRKSSKTPPQFDGRSLYSPISFDDLPRKRSMDASMDIIKQNERNNSLEISSNKRNGSLDLTSCPFRGVDGQRSISPKKDLQFDFRKRSSATTNGDPATTVTFVSDNKKGFGGAEKGFLGEEKSSMCQIL